MHSIALACQAMATRFELVLHGDDPIMLRSAGEEALEEIRRIEAQLSLYEPSSEIAHLNARAAHEPVRVSPPIFELLKQAQELSRATAGAFDITVAPLMRCWGFMKDTGRVPKARELADARAKVGMHLVQLDAKNCSVRFERPGVMLDLGAIGKGYAIEQAAGLLRESGVASAILHGGTSTVYAIGAPPDAASWNIAVECPPRDDTPPPLLAVVPLRDEGMSVSAVWGKFFRAGEKTYGHVIDPRTGQPVTAHLLAAVVAPSGTETDALSTALLTDGKRAHDSLPSLRPRARSLLLEQTEANGRFRCWTRGIELHAQSSHLLAAGTV